MILIDKSSLNECGGGPGPMGGGAAPMPGISTGDVLGHCDHGHGCGYLGPGCFHVPFPVMPMLTRWGWSASKKKKGKKDKKVKNPYAAHMKVIKEDESEKQIEYSGDAEKTLHLVTAEENDPFIDVLYLNRKYMLAWKICNNGVLSIYKPVSNGPKWQICRLDMLENGKFKIIDTIGKFKDEAEALAELRKNVEEHSQKLNEAISGHDLNRWAATGFNPARFPALKSRPNLPFLQQELKRRFPGEFEDVRIKDFGRYAVDFQVRLPDNTTEIRGQQRAATVIPGINRIMSFLRMRGVDVNSYDVCVKSRI